MDLANFNKSLSQSITHEMMLECNRLCFNEGESIPNVDCIRNCTFKQCQLLKIFNNTIHQEIPRLQELTRI